MLKKSLLIVVLLCFSTIVAAQDWRVDRLSNDVHYTTDGRTWLALQTGMAVPNNSWVSTGPRGRAIFARGTERIILRAETLVAVQTWEAGGTQTKITQNAGAVLLSLVTRSRPHTTVETPHLSAVVKGTVFEVTVSGGQSVLRVDRGRVSVTNRASRQTIDATAGQEAIVDNRQSGVATRAASGSSLRSGNQLTLEPVARSQPTGRADGSARQQGRATGRQTTIARPAPRANSERRPAGDRRGPNGNGNGNGNGGNGGNSNGNGGNAGNGSGNGGNNGNGSGDVGNAGNGTRKHKIVIIQKTLRPLPHPSRGPWKAQPLTDHLVSDLSE